MDKVFCSGCGKEWIWIKWDWGFNAKTGKPARFGQWQCPDYNKFPSNPPHTHDDTYQLIKNEWIKER